MHPLAQIRQNLRTCGARAPALRPVALHTIRERYGVARIGISGSVMQNEETPASDIDILVEFREGEETFDTRSLAVLKLLPCSQSHTLWTSSSTLRISLDEGRTSSSPIP
ncbi:nucleotidyltransferase family protein [Methanoculleus sp. UBA303]|uniref:nucleotidyltransferase family protein n=1 Tax=Methanoculleus sp. UBA303 TaxID=1915497 RepID=UPI0032E4230D